MNPESVKEPKTIQMTLRIPPRIIKAIDEINRTKYGGLRSRASLMLEGLWKFAGEAGCGWNEQV